MDDEINILRHPHSRNVASTNYNQYYIKQYENEIVSKKNEFYNLFKKYRELKEDEKAFLDLKKLIESMKPTKKSTNSNLNIGTDTIINIHEKRGVITGYNEFISKTLNAVKSYSKSTNTNIDSLAEKKYTSNIEEENSTATKKDPKYSEEFQKQIGRFKAKGNNIMKEIFNIEHEYRQEIIDDALLQTIEAKKLTNNDFSNY